MWITTVLSGVGKIFAVFCIYVVAKWLYNVFLHPLSRYPGPFYTAASRLPLSYVTAQGKALTWHQKLHDRYGDVVRVGPNELSYINADAWNDIYNRRGDNENPKDQLWFKGAAGMVDSMISIPSAKDHAKVRRVFSAAFSDAALKKQEPLLRKYGDAIVRSVKRQTKEGENVFDIVRLFNFTTFDIMSDLAFGAPFGLIENAEYTPFVQTIFSATKAVTILRIMAYFPPLQDVVLGLLSPLMKEKRDEFFRFAADQVNRRLANQRIAPDIWNLVLTQEATKDMSLEEMHANSALFLAAGTETTATTLSGLTYLLLTHPQYMLRVKSEIRESFQEEQDIKMEALARLPFLNACIEETLRMYPPLPTGAPREAPKGGTMISDQFVPGGTSMYVPQYVSFRSETHFKHPNDFRPERWLGDAEFAGDNKAAVQPFSTGPRNCIGKNLAYHEMRLVFALVIWNFDLELVNDDGNWLDQLVWTLWEKTPLMVRMSSARDDLSSA